MEKFEVEFKKTSLKQLRKFPKSIQFKIQDGIQQFLVSDPFKVDGKHIKKLTDGYRLRIGDYRVFYFVEKSLVLITSIVRRTSTTY